MTTPDTPLVTEVADRHRYEIALDGQRVGLTAYRDRDDQRVFYHTEIDKAFGGRGLGGTLIEQALTDVRKQGKRIVPVCPFVAKYLQKNDGFADITDPVTPEIRSWLDTQLG